MKSNNERFFEVIDRHNVRHHFSRDKGYMWAWKPKVSESGIMDDDDYQCIDVIRVDGSGEALEEISFPHPVAVGNLPANVGLSLPEKQINRCPKCGFGELK